MCTKQSDITVLSHFWPLLTQLVFFEAKGAVSEIGSSLKPNQVKLVKIPNTDYRMRKTDIKNLVSEEDRSYTRGSGNKKKIGVTKRKSD